VTCDVMYTYPTLTLTLTLNPRYVHPLKKSGKAAGARGSHDESYPSNRGSGSNTSDTGKRIYGSPVRAKLERAIELDKMNISEDVKRGSEDGEKGDENDAERECEDGDKAEEKKKESKSFNLKPKSSVRSSPYPDSVIPSNVNTILDAVKPLQSKPYEMINDTISKTTTSSDDQEGNVVDMVRSRIYTNPNANPNPNPNSNPYQLAHAHAEEAYWRALLENPENSEGGVEGLAEELEHDRRYARMMNNWHRKVAIICSVV
jgi:hypothetical protein